MQSSLTEVEQLRIKLRRVEKVIDLLDAKEGATVDSDLVALNLREALRDKATVRFSL